MAVSSHFKCGYNCVSNFGLHNIFLLSALLFVIHFPSSQTELAFEAAFQGECRSNGPCQHLCFDLHDGTFECACKGGYTLASNGYSCIDNDIYENTTNRTRGVRKGLHEGNKKLFDGSRRELLTENLKEDKPIYYSCLDIECEAGGTCVLDERHEDMRIRCRCPLGRGGFFCEKPVEVRFPRFRGSSYLALPTLRDAHKSMQVNIEFQPEHHDGVLLYSGEKQTLEGDFIAVILNQGFVEFRFDCGMGEGILRSDMPVVLNSWNTLSIYRDGWNAWMQLNQGQQVTGQSKGLFSRITFRLELFLGGSPNMTQISKRAHTSSGFRGCVRTLEINERLYDFRSDNRGDTIDGVDIGECVSDVCSKTLCLNSGQCIAVSPDKGVCLCPLGYAGDHCEQVSESIGSPSFNGSSYLQYPGLGETALSFLEMYIVFKPRKINGLILYNGNRMDGNGDFLSLNLVDGYVEFRFDLGSGPAIIRNVIPILENEWHTVFISRTGREGTLQVDDQPLVKGTTPGAFTQLSLALNLFIGGVSDLKDVQRESYATSLFAGCIQKVTINNRPLMLLDEALSGVNVVDCSHICNQHPCQQGGHCVPLLESYSCNCPKSHFGPNCEREVDEILSTPMFYGNSYFEYNHEEILKRISGFKTDIRLRIRAFSPEGVLIWFGTRKSSSSLNFLSLGIKNGFVQLDFNLGSGSVQVTHNLSRIDDGQWHNLHLSRYKREAKLTIDDDYNSVKATSPATKIKLNENSRLFLGGLEDTLLQSDFKYRSGFIGCVSQLTLDKSYKVDLVSQSLRGINVRACI